MGMRYKILCGDPARSNDYFAFVGIEYDTDTDTIYIKFARQYQGKPFSAVARDMLPIIKKIKPHVFCLESNNEGKTAIKSFEKLGIRTRAIYTTSKTNDDNARMETMPKGYTVKDLKVRFNDKRVFFPTQQNATIKELKLQMQLFTQYVTLNGSTTYRASRGHDDLVSALLLTCHIARMIADES